MGLVQKDGANLVADGGAAGIPRYADADAQRLEPFPQQSDLRALAAAVRTVDDDEFTAKFFT